MSSLETSPPAGSAPSVPRLLAYVGIGAFLFALVTYWGGLPPEDELPAFLFGAATLIIFMSGLSVAAWHLMIRPLPQRHSTPREISISATIRRLLAFLVLISAISLVTGAFWDEVWHRQYGVPFGEDFFWRPHLMMYFGLTMIILLSFGGLYLLMSRGKGTFQQRFRANPTIGLLVLTGAFLMYSLPADPIWHIIYGADISAWSLPHILLALSFSAIMLLAAAIQLSTLPRRGWALMKFRPADIIPLVGYAFAIMLMMQLLATEWDTQNPARVSAILRDHRPEWVFPVMIVSIAVVFGTIALHSLRWFGAASMVGLISLAGRVLYLETFQFYEITTNGWLLLLPPLVALDIAYLLVWRSRGQVPPAWVAGVVAWVAGVALTIPLINTLYVFPTFSADNLLAPLIAVGVVAVGASYIGRAIGDYLTSLTFTQDAPERVEVIHPNAGRFAFVALVVLLAFVGVFITTATPPV